MMGLPRTYQFKEEVSFKQSKLDDFFSSVPVQNRFKCLVGDTDGEDHPASQKIMKGEQELIDHSPSSDRQTFRSSKDLQLLAHQTVLISKTMKEVFQVQEKMVSAP